MKKLVFIFLFFPLMSFAQNASVSEDAVIYGLYCTTTHDLIQTVPVKDRADFTTYLTSKDFLAQRAGFQTMLKSPVEEIKKMLDTADELGALLNCSVVDAIKDRVAAGGCTAEDGSALTITAALAACQPILDNSPLIQ